jgi:hypothetical protein
MTAISIRHLSRCVSGMPPRNGDTSRRSHGVAPQQGHRVRRVWSIADRRSAGTGDTGAGHPSRWPAGSGQALAHRYAALAHQAFANSARRRPRGVVDRQIDRWDRWYCFAIPFPEVSRQGPAFAATVYGATFSSIAFATRSASSVAQFGSLYGGAALVLGTAQVRVSTTTLCCAPNAC